MNLSLATAKGATRRRRQRCRRRALVKRPDMRGTTNLMIYVAHATSPAISNLMLYDHRAVLHVHTYVHICILRVTDYPPLT